MRMRDKHLIIVDYDPQWPTLFANEKARLQGAVGEYVETIEHIGSTAVPGLAAKPVIDIAIGVSHISIADQHCIQRIARLGYEYYQAVEALMPTRRYFRKSDADGMRTHQIHVWALDDPEYERHILFRDYLRAHPEEAEAYAKLKRELAQQLNNVRDYADAKSVFIQPCQRRAYAWKQALQAK